MTKIEVYITLPVKNQSMQTKEITKRKKKGKRLVYEETRQKRRKNVTKLHLLCREDGGIPTQSAKMSRMDGTHVFKHFFNN